MKGLFVCLFVVFSIPSFRSPFIHSFLSILPFFIFSFSLYFFAFFFPSFLSLFFLPSFLSLSFFLVCLNFFLPSFISFLSLFFPSFIFFLAFFLALFPFFLPSLFVCLSLFFFLAFCFVYFSFSVFDLCHSFLKQLLSALTFWLNESLQTQSQIKMTRWGTFSQCMSHISAHVSYFCRDVPSESSF